MEWGDGICKIDVSIGHLIDSMTSGTKGGGTACSSYYLL